MALSPQERSRRMRLNMLMAMSYAVAGRSAAFTPLSLFSAGEVGAWYDPSDFSTMFQDSAGTTPVTAVEQPVGLIRDKSGRGNHASQTTSTSRPVLSARVNLLTYTEDFSNAAWTKERVTLSGSEIIETATTGVHGVYTTSGLSLGTLEHRLTARVQYSNCQYISIGYYDAGGTAGAGFDLVNGTVTGTGASGAGWSASGATITQVSAGIYDCSVLIIGGGGTRYPGVYMRNTAYTSGAITESYAGSTAKKVVVTRMDLRSSTAGSSLPPYQRVGAATAGTSSAAGTGDYDTTGFPYYLRDDLVDDTMNWTATAGSNYTVAWVERGGTVTIQTAQSLSGSTDMLRAQTVAGYVAVNRALSSTETANLTAWLTDKGSG